MAGLVGFIIPNRIQPVVLLTKSSFSMLLLLLLLCLHVSSISTISDIFTSSQESQGSDPHMYLL